MYNANRDFSILILIIFRETRRNFSFVSNHIKKQIEFKNLETLVEEI